MTYTSVFLQGILQVVSLSTDFTYITTFRMNLSVTLYSNLDSRHKITFFASEFFYQMPFPIDKTQKKTYNIHNLEHVSALEQKQNQIVR